MSNKIHGNQFHNCGTGISAPSDANLDIGDNQFVACGKAIDLRDTPSLISALGLRSDTPIELVREILSFSGVAPRSASDIQSKSESIGLFKWLAAGADTSTLVSAVAGLYAYVPAILAALPK